MPYSTPIYFPSMQAYFDQITDAKKTIVIPEPIQDNDEECKDMTVKKTNSFNSNESENIILEPVLNPTQQKASITNQESETILTKMKVVVISSARTKNVFVIVPHVMEKMTAVIIVMKLVAVTV